MIQRERARPFCGPRVLRLANYATIDLRARDEKAADRPSAAE